MSLPPYIRRYPGVLSVVSEDPDTAGLGELCVLVVKVLSGHEPADQCPGVPCAQQGAGEHHAVEGNVVLGHELPVLHVVRVLPPQLPLRRVLRRDADVPDRGVEPYVEHLPGGIPSTGGFGRRNIRTSHL